MKRFRLLAPAFALIACLAACSSTRLIESSMATNVAAFHPADPAKPEDGGTITVRYINETVASLGFTRAEHRLYLEGKLVAQFANDTAFGILSVSDITRDLPVRFDSPAYVRELAARGPVVHYRLESKIFQRLGDDRNELKLTAEGSLDLRGTPAP
ncbi:MAG TPA: hypothetical protein VHE13_18160 [Opitutus sp.]|nr:hypothetical protein [Opitutus sp.]